MLALSLPIRKSQSLRLLCIGAHSDDLEIGCGGAVLSWLESRPSIDVTWVVLTAQADRAREARKSAKALLKRAANVEIVLGDFKDGFLVAQYEAVETWFQSIKSHVPRPDIVFTHRLEDRHQDHRLASELTWNTWRDHLILEYEIMKYEGDLGQPNVFVPLQGTIARRKATHLKRHFGSQRAKGWFTEQNFLALARLRGVECRAESGYAEAFHARKLVLAPTTL